MGLNDAKIQQVTWKEGSSLDSMAAYSGITTKEHAKALAGHINQINPNIAAYASPASELEDQNEYRIHIKGDDSLKIFKEEFPAVEVSPQRQHMSRYRKGSEAGSNERSR